MKKIILNLNKCKFNMPSDSLDYTMKWRDKNQVSDLLYSLHAKQINEIVKCHMGGVWVPA